MLIIQAVDVKNWYLYWITTLEPRLHIKKYLFGKLYYCTTLRETCIYLFVSHNYVLNTDRGYDNTGGSYFEDWSGLVPRAEIDFTLYKLHLVTKKKKSLRGKREL